MKTQYAPLLTLLIAATATADIYQYSDCDGNGTLLLTELNAEPFVDLSELYLGCADLNYADLTGADLNYANLNGANLTGADLNYADLTGANLFYANLNYADLINANLYGANLTNADLYGAYLTGANLTNADLTGAYNWQSSTWTGATYNDATIFPEGMNPEKLGMIYDDTADVTEGACCVTSGCDVMEEAMCTNLGGTWTEAGSCDDCVAPPETCDADLDNNGEVNIDDLLQLIGAWGACQ